MSELIIGGRYKTIEVIGKGGMGMVYRARDTRLDRDVAIKVIHTGNTQNDSAAMLHREAQSIAQLHHSNIVTIYDYSGPDESPIYIAMELIEGETLTKIMQRTKTLPDTVLMSVLYSVSSALAHAHEHQMIHRDIKPSNIMIEPSGRVLLMDFGIAKSLAGPGGGGHTQMRGTPNFMAPEQILEQPIGTYTDIFALGVLMYTCAVGKPPFMSNSTIETMQKIAELRYDPMRQVKPEVSSGIERLSRQCMRAEPDKRPTAAEINKACRLFLKQKQVLNPIRHLALYMAEQLGIPAEDVESSLSANTMSGNIAAAAEEVPARPISRITRSAAATDAVTGDEPTRIDNKSPVRTAPAKNNSTPANFPAANKNNTTSAQPAAELAGESTNVKSGGSFFSVFLFILVMGGLLSGGIIIFNNLKGQQEAEQRQAAAKIAAKATLELAPGEERVTIKIVPRGRLMIDGMEKGFYRGSVDVGLEPGKHKIEVKDRDRVPIVKSITVVKGQPLTVVLDFNKQ